jgi:thiamine-phosphate pyrophosphorylase
VRGTLPSPLYAIADPCDRPALDPVELAAAMLDGGAKIVQLRWKGAPAARLFDAAVAIRRLAAERGARFVVNDRADVTLAAGADGVHLGQDDLPLEAARRLLGASRLIGISTHTVEQARDAERGGADYIGFGPLFGTGTKATAYTPRGLDALAAVREAVRLPIVAIGGICEGHASAVLAAGADAVAMISELALAADVRAKVQSVIGTLRLAG